MTKCRSFLRTWSHLLKKFLMEKFIFYAVQIFHFLFFYLAWPVASRRFWSLKQLTVMFHFSFKCHWFALLLRLLFPCFLFAIPILQSLNFLFYYSFDRGWSWHPLTYPSPRYFLLDNSRPAITMNFILSTTNQLLNWHTLHEFEVI